MLHYCGKGVSGVQFDTTRTERIFVLSNSREEVLSRHIQGVLKHLSYLLLNFLVLSIFHSIANFKYQVHVDHVRFGIKSVPYKYFNRQFLTFPVVRLTLFLGSKTQK